MVTNAAPGKTAAAKKAPTKAATTVKAVAKKPVAPAAKAAAPKVLAPKPTVTAVKPGKAKKPKLVRDSFTIPKDEYVVIDLLKVRAGKLGQAVKKSELLRAGIKALAALSDIQFKAALSNVPTIKTGRPKDVK